MSSLVRFLTSSIGRKLLMGASGLLLLAFLVVHLSGNLLVFAGRERFNDYSHQLLENPLIYVAEARQQGRITDLAPDPLMTYKAYWDIGIADATAIWIMQQRGDYEVRVLPLSRIGNECSNLHEVIDVGFLRHPFLLLMNMPGSRRMSGFENAD